MSENAGAEMVTEVVLVVAEPHFVVEERYEDEDEVVVAEVDEEPWPLVFVELVKEEDLDHEDGFEGWFQGPWPQGGGLGTVCVAVAGSVLTGSVWVTFTVTVVLKFDAPPSPNH